MQASVIFCLVVNQRILALFMQFSDNRAFKQYSGFFKQLVMVFRLKLQEKIHLAINWMALLFYRSMVSRCIAKPSNNIAIGETKQFKLLKI